MDNNDENITLLLSMGFPHIEEIKRALRIAKNDLSEAVAILTNDQPMGPYDPLANDIEMPDVSSKAEGSDDKGCDDGSFPTTNLYELEQRVFQDNWSIPYKREESLGKCLIAMTRILTDGSGIKTIEEDADCQKFLNCVMPEAFKKLLTSNATAKWHSEIQEGIFNMVELFIDMCLVRLPQSSSSSGGIPVSMLNTLALAFDIENDWNYKNRSQTRWESVSNSRSSSACNNEEFTDTSTTHDYGWLCDLIHRFGHGGGFKMITDCIDTVKDLSGKELTALLKPLAYCAVIADKVTLDGSMNQCLDAAFVHIQRLQETELKAKEMACMPDLFNAVKLIAHYFRPEMENHCDSLQLKTIMRMLKTPSFATRMSGLKEVSRLIEETQSSSHSYLNHRRKSTTVLSISSQQLTSWMSDNQVLSVALEGNIDHVQYSDRLKAIVDFLGPNLGKEDLDRIWYLQDRHSSSMENIHAIISSASSKISWELYLHLTSQIKAKWESSSNERTREKLLCLIGQIGREAKQGKSIEATLQVLWEVSHLKPLPRHLLERALSEQLAIITEINLNRDTHRRKYVQLCVEDIQDGQKEHVLPAVIHLRQLCQSFTKTGSSSSYFQKNDRAILSELNSKHEIVRLLSNSLSKCRQWDIEASVKSGLSTQADSIIDDRYSHEEYINEHLALMKFFLKEGNLYLSKGRAKEVWETLVDSPRALVFDKEKCYDWFRECMTDLVNDTQKDFFNQKLLARPPATVSSSAFQCFRDYFESVNASDGKIRKNFSTNLTVESLDLIGYDYIWRLITECIDDTVANDITEYMLKISYIDISAKLKKDARQLHQRFIDRCYHQLKTVTEMTKSTAIKAPTTESSTVHAMQQGFELETCSNLIEGGDLEETDSKNLTTRLRNRSAAASSSSDNDYGGDRGQIIRRLIHLLERYVSVVEDGFHGKRHILPHAATFLGRPLVLKVTVDVKKEEFEMQCHSNELVQAMKKRLSEKLQKSVSDMTFECSRHGLLGTNKDNLLLDALTDHNDHASGNVNANRTSGELEWTVTINSTATTSSSALLVFDDSASSSTTGANFHHDDQEKSLPGVLMMSRGNHVIFPLLYKLSATSSPSTKDSAALILSTLSRLLHKIPTDTNVIEDFESIEIETNHSAADASPKVSPRKTASSREMAAQTIHKLLDPYSVGMSALRVWYNLSVLSSRLMPIQGQFGHSLSFTQQFQKANGLKAVLQIFNKDFLPPDTEQEMRQSIYVLALQVTRCLLCGIGDSAGLPPPPPTNSTSQLYGRTTSPLMKPTPPKKTALDASAAAVQSMQQPLEVNISAVKKAVQTMSEDEFLEMVTILMGLAWSFSAGDLQLLASASSSSAAQNNLRSSDYTMGSVQAGQSTTTASLMRSSRRSRDSSTGSSTGSTDQGSSVFQGTSPAAVKKSALSKINQSDELIATEAFDLMVTSLSMRNVSLSSFFNLPTLSDFVIETILASPSAKVRQAACQQLKRLSRIKANKLPRRRLDLDNNPAASAAKIEEKKTDEDARVLLTRLVLKAPVPLWMPSCKSRGVSHFLLGQCNEYFELRCYLLQGLSSLEQGQLSLCAKSMLEDELTFLNTYVPCSRNKSDDCNLIAGHLKVVEALISADGIDVSDVGFDNVILELLDTHLFPASKVILEGSLHGRDINPRCDTSQSRVAAYNLLTKLSKGNGDNLTSIVDNLIKMHHTFDESLATEFEFEPLVDRRAACNYVGLKNAGATCYMNSCLQQVYCVPGLSAAVLSSSNDNADNQIEDDDDDTIFYQLQNVFGHLSTSKLQYFVPEKFWQTFRLFGQPVNVREQQDAFEFFTQIIDQVDEWLAARNRPKIFPAYFEGIFSDHKICQECPCKYEREQPFMALNLTVKSNNLTESLDQFVRGELLEGDNAYYCEKCQAKRSAVKRMSIRKLPKTLVIQLKRFHYDHETNRAVKFDDYFEFPRQLDMSPYTTEGIRQAEKTSETSKVQRSRTLSTSSMSSASMRQKTGGQSQANQKMMQVYDLVGMVVHSGSAGAGHYYSFIKDRSSDKWFKFNDTSVEEMEMTEETLAQECFGGSFKVKKSDNQHSSALPENRQRYWNAYMLFYEKRSQNNAGIGNVISSMSYHPVLRTASMSTSFHAKPNRKTSMPTTMTTTSTSSQPQARESLSQLSDLLEKGEKRGIFYHCPSIPTSIEQAISESNLRFLLRRDVFSADYYNFVIELLNVNALSRAAIKKDERLALQSVKLAVYFSLNTYAHIKKRQKQIFNEIIEIIDSYLQKSSSATSWMLEFLSSQEGLCYMRPFLLECGAKEVRHLFSQLLIKAFRYQKLHFSTLTENKDDEATDKILASLRALLRDGDVAKHIKHCSQLFLTLSKFAQEGLRQCEQLFNKDFFPAIVKLLIGLDLDEEDLKEKIQQRQRKWAAPSQNRELGELHLCLASLILACDTSLHQDHHQTDGGQAKFHGLLFSGAVKLLEIPKAVSQLLFGPLAQLYIREAVSAVREVNASCVTTIIQALVHASVGSEYFTNLLMKELLKQYNTVSSGELKNLSMIFIELLVLSDPLQSKRISYAVDGDKDEADLEGLLTLVDKQQSTDSCRAYQCIKTLVAAANKSSNVKEKLILDSEKWQWAVNWLKLKMDNQFSAASSSATSSATAESSSINMVSAAAISSCSAISSNWESTASNEDSLSRNFHRTTSAVLTLQEANSILADFEAPAEPATATSKMEVDGDEEEDVLRIDEYI